jgi:hypothetical protein
MAEKRKTPSGGARPGAGRKKGAATQRTREAADALAKDGGKLPLDVMMTFMRAAYAEHEELCRAASKDPESMTTAKLKEAAEVAATAAPYMHPRLSSITANVGGTLTHEHWTKTLSEPPGTSETGRAGDPPPSA